MMIQYFKGAKGGPNMGGSGMPPGMPEGFMKPGGNAVKQFSVDSNVKVKFNDVAGLDEAKLEIV
jgi:ATP-dependent Zn protease